MFVISSCGLTVLTRILQLCQREVLRVYVPALRMQLVTFSPLTMVPSDLLDTIFSKSRCVSFLPKLLTWKDIDFYHVHSSAWSWPHDSHSTLWAWCFFYRFADIEGFFQLKDKIHLMTVHNQFNGVLDSVCCYYTQSVDSCVHQGYWLPVIFFSCTLCLIWFRVIIP